MQVEQSYLKICEALGLQATAQAHLDAAAIKARADASEAKDERISHMQQALRTAMHWLRTAHGKTAVREKVPGIEEKWTIDMMPGIEAIEVALDMGGGRPGIDVGDDGMVLTVWWGREVIGRIDRVRTRSKDRPFRYDWELVGDWAASVSPNHGSASHEQGARDAVVSAFRMSSTYDRDG